LIAGRFIDVAQLPFSAEREAVLLPIRIPLHKGLIGWRIGLIRKGDQARFSKIKTVEDLKKIRIGQSSEWPDVGVLRFNGMNVVTGSTYEGLFAMLVGGRFDYFMRDVIEIWDELRDHAGIPMEVEQSFAVHYYYDAYFCVNKRNTKLAEDIRQGLEQAVADGSFEKLFQQYFSDSLRKARLDERTVIELSSPDVNSETPIWRRELWYSLKQH
jgi:ABC-type amino acid transport substrate-binding protein